MKECVCLAVTFEGVCVCVGVKCLHFGLLAFLVDPSLMGFGVKLDQRLLDLTSAARDTVARSVHT